MKTIVSVFALLLFASFAKAQAPAPRLIVYSVERTAGLISYKTVVLAPDGRPTYYLLVLRGWGTSIPCAGIYDATINSEGRVVSVRIPHFAHPVQIVNLDVLDTYSGEELELPARFQKVEATPRSKTPSNDDARV
jgi:hypothetical protein